jgi:hypothetical protein
MNEHNSVEVFLGKPIDVASERQFLARLRRDLEALGVSARIFANLQVGPNGDRQVDFIVITRWRTVVIELKTFPGPILSGPRNGRWTVKVGDGSVAERRNPLAQVLAASQHLSDELHGFASKEDVPGPSGRKFWTDLDAVACVFPSLADGSAWDPVKHVELIGYEDLLIRLQEAGPSVRWSQKEWDRFIRHMNLYRAEEDAPENLIRSAGAEAVDSYAGRFLEAEGGHIPFAATTVEVDGTRADRPNLAKMLASGKTVLLHGRSGAGKTIWARNVAVELAAAGHLPIWVDPDTCQGSFRTACARAVAPYTVLEVNELVKASDAAGRSVVFVVDDLGKISAEMRRRLADGLRTIRVRGSGRGLLMTDQGSDAASRFGERIDIDLLPPDDDDRLAVLTAYGHAEVLDRCEAFSTPLELSVAASCAEDLPSEPDQAQLFDTYVERIVDGDPVTRGALRAIASSMVAELRPFLSRGDVARLLRRALGTSDEELRVIFDCGLLTSARGRISFRHEQFERFLAAEAMLIEEADPTVLARRLNSPSAAGLGGHVIGLEHDRDSLLRLSSLIEEPALLVEAADGRFGTLAKECVTAVLVESVADACALTTDPDIRLRISSDLLSDSDWEIPKPQDRAQIARLGAVGRLLAKGVWTEGVDVLLRLTDELCDRAATKSRPADPESVVGHIFATTYGLPMSGGLPVTPLAEGATSHFHLGRDEPDRTASTIDRLLSTGEDPGRGALWIAAHLLRFSELPVRVDVVTRCVGDSAYHLRLIGLQLAEDRSWRLTEDESLAIAAEIDALSSANFLEDGARLEALAALGGVQPANTEGDIEAEIEEVLAMADGPVAEKRAYGILGNQFEGVFLGPYYEVVTKLAPEKRVRLLTMALRACDYIWMTDGYILGELENVDDEAVRKAVIGYVSRFSPERHRNNQWAMQALIRAIALLAQAEEPVPVPSAGVSDPAWQAALELIRAAATRDDELLSRSWSSFVDEYPDGVPSLVGKLRGVRRLGEESLVLDRLEGAMPASASDALVDALQHPDRIRAVGGRDFDLRADVVAKLADIGDRRAAEALRRYADDPSLGLMASQAVRSIEVRLS